MNYDNEVLRKLQLVELAVLIEIDRVCRENDIMYFLDSGTLLGAVRHGGFIPWDDDVDIGMLRSDYERFMAIAAKELGENYVVSDCRLRDDHAAMFAKVWKKGTKFSTNETVEAGIPQGIFVDIFPYDTLHADASIARTQAKKSKKWQAISYLYHAKTITVPHKGILGTCEKLCCRMAHAIISRVFTHERICSSFDRVARIGVTHQGTSCMALAYPIGDGFSQDTLLPPRDIVFENCTFFGPADPECYLTTMFGSSWGELPPMDQRRNHAPCELDFGD